MASRRWRVRRGLTMGRACVALTKTRYDTIFDRMTALGMEVVGPQAPYARQATPWPADLPTDSKDVPTYHSNRQTPPTATRELDYVFASKSLADRVQVRAMNDPDSWGPSDHSRVEIEIG